MGAGGFMHDGNKRHTFNKSLLKSKKGLFSSIGFYQGKNKITPFEEKEPDQNELKRIKARVKSENVNEVRRLWFILLLSLLGGSFLSYLFYAWMMA